MSRRPAIPLVHGQVDQPGLVLAGRYCRVSRGPPRSAIRSRLRHRAPPRSRGESLEPSWAWSRWSGTRLDSGADPTSTAGPVGRTTRRPRAGAGLQLVDDEFADRFAFDVWTPPDHPRGARCRVGRLAWTGWWNFLPKPSRCLARRHRPGHCLEDLQRAEFEPDVPKTPSSIRTGYPGRGNHALVGSRAHAALRSAWAIRRSPIVRRVGREASATGSGSHRTKMR